MHRAGVEGFLRCLPGGVAFERHAALGAIPRPVRRHAGAHRAEVFRGGGRLHGAAAVGEATRRATATIAGLAHRFGFCPATAFALGAGRRQGNGFRKTRWADELLPALLATKIERLPVALHTQRGRFVHGHSANGVLGHKSVLHCEAGSQVQFQTTTLGASATGLNDDLLLLGCILAVTPWCPPGPRHWKVSRCGTAQDLLPQSSRPSRSADLPSAAAPDLQERP